MIGKLWWEIGNWLLNKKYKEERENQKEKFGRVTKTAKFVDLESH